MKTVIRQDGSTVELSEKDAARWLQLGLATEPQKAAPAKEKDVKPTPANNTSEGE